ncbi:pectin lyase fold/virulence factor [Auriculariales sp. MPI-PUGE-AT-0066]|nr:pectin lyase fold/virulence factor [Auriculariales sp. MPI-PUGE-AT-0066]
MFSASVLLAVLAALHSVAAAKGKTQYCTLKASGGDDSPTIEHAFRASTRFARQHSRCEHVTIPADQNLLIGTKLNTTGLEDTHVRLLGKMTLKPDVSMATRILYLMEAQLIIHVQVDYWRDNAFNVTYQVNSAAWLFGGKNVILDGEGQGEINGNGQTFYDARIANDSLRPPHLMLAYKANGMTLRNFKIRQSPRWTILVHSSKHVEIHDLDIRSRSDTWALGRESNRETDGVDIYDSKYIFIHDMKIDNGDDCISFKPNATSIYVSNIWCNGTHGCSVGSLGEYEGVLDIVEDIYVNNVTIQNSENGPRIKTWGGAGRGYGRVNQVVFSNFEHINNDSPVTIDNCYKTSPDDCLATPSLMTISNVYFTNQKGTSSGKYGNAAIALVCSVGKCSNIHLDNISLKAPSECGDTVYANHHVNVQGNAAYLFQSDAATYGAGGINPDNSTVSGVRCENGQVVPIINDDNGGASAAKFRRDWNDM